MKGNRFKDLKMQRLLVDGTHKSHQMKFMNAR